MKKQNIDKLILDIKFKNLTNTKIIVKEKESTYYLHVENEQNLEINTAKLYELLVSNNISIEFHNCTIVNNIELDVLSDTNNTLIFYECNFTEIRIEGKNNYSLDISLSTFKDCVFNRIYLTNTQFQYVHFNDYSGSIKIDELWISKIKVLNTFLISLNELNYIDISNLDVKGGILIYIKKGDVISIEDSVFNNYISIEDSIFDEILLLDVEFNNNTSFKNTKTDTISISNVHFNPDRKIDFTKFDIKNIKQTDISIFRTVRMSLEKIGNKIEANRFHSYEMKARKFELQNDENEKFNFNDKIIFYTNDLISNHGLKWYLPLFWMIFVGLYFTIIFYSIDKKYFIESCILVFISTLFIIVSNNMVHSKEDIKKRVKTGIYLGSLFIACIVYYLNFNGDINPLIKFINILDFNDNKLTNTNITDLNKFSSKIIMGYLSYHFIFALRKDTRY